MSLKLTQIIINYALQTKLKHLLQDLKILMLTKNILKKFRQIMAIKNIGIYVLPRTDEHQSEYLCPCDERIKYLSGFSGSNAIALVSQKQALLWTDGRYYLQAAQQLREGWQMRKLIDGQKKWFQHIIDKYEPKNNNIQIDGRLISAKNAKERKKMFEEKGFSIHFTNQNLVDQIWENRPKSSAAQIFSHQNWAGKRLSQKISWIRNKINQKKGQGALFTELGEISWILNLRSSEIPYNPFFKSILIIKKQGGQLYLPKSHISSKDHNIIQHLKKKNIQIKQYDPVYPHKLLCQPNLLNFSVYSQLVEPIQWDGIGIYRAVRTQKQLQGFRTCHIYDGIAMAKFWAWRSSKQQVNQYQAAEVLDNFRKQQPNNKGLSFTTISGGGPNGAIIHYNATKQNSSTVTKNMIHLVDSGGQYLNGTTDVTRAFHFGNPTQQQKDSYTRVLLGNLQIQRLKWPKTVKLTGIQIDVLARKYLWNVGKQYLHGTGHGVGYFGSVHEGPVGISRLNKIVLQPGMIVTNQPGYYEAGKYGIRIQNMLIVRQVSEHQKLYGFQNLTLCPYDRNLIDIKLLTKDDIEHIDKYHERVYKTLSPYFQKDQHTLKWLKFSTQPLQLE